MPLKCVIHYDSLVPEKEELTPLNESTFKALLDNKSARERLGVANAHSPQFNSIPSVLDDKTHGIHRKCYQKFTKGISIEKKKRQKEQTILPSSNPKRPRRSGEGAKQLFPKVCLICKSSERKWLKDGTKETLHKIT